MAHEPVYSLKEFAVKVGVSWNVMRYRWSIGTNKPQEAKFTNTLPIKNKRGPVYNRYKLSELQKWWDTVNVN